MSLRRLLNLVEAYIVEAHGLSREGVDELKKVLAEPFMTVEESERKHKQEENRRSVAALRRVLPADGGFGGFGTAKAGAF